jgi:hypothetical protein
VKKRGRGDGDTPPENYSEYLDSPHWQEVRRDALRRADYRCERCGRTRGLDVHHKKGRYNTVGHETPGDVEVLDHDCHALEHAPAMIALVQLRSARAFSMWRQTQGAAYGDADAWHAYAEAMDRSGLGLDFLRYLSLPFDEEPPEEDRGHDTA